MVVNFLEEETKEGAEKINFVDGSEDVVVHDDDDKDDKDEDEVSKAEDDDSVVEELEDLPPEILVKIGGEGRCCFDSEEALESALVEAGFGDLPVVLVEDGKPRLVVPSDQHDKFTSDYDIIFNHTWAKNQWGAVSATQKIWLSNGNSRQPDLNFWGYPRCRRNKDGVLLPICESIPNVIIQFSWQNKAQYEEDVINDMMNRALERKHGALSITLPTLGYLIKVRFSRKRTLPGSIEGSKTQDMEGLDIYRLKHGTTVANARDPSNCNAQYWRYVPGGQEVFITITTKDLSITGAWSWFCGKYTIEASTIFEEMNQFHKQRQMRGVAT